MLLATTVGGCKVEEKSDAKVSDMKFTVISEKELPDELKKIIEAKNAVYFKSELIGPGENDVSEKVESYPYIVVSTEKTEDIVVFE